MRERGCATDHLNIGEVVIMKSVNHFTDEELKNLAKCAVDSNIACNVTARVHLMSDREATVFAEYYRLYSMS